MPFQETLTYEDVAEKLGYDADTGQFAWLVDVGRNVKAGSEAGTVKTTRVDASGKPVQYRYIRLLGRTFPAARLAWLLHHGEWPKGRIAPIDGDTLNLRIANLSETHALPDSYDTKDPEGRKQYHRDHRQMNPLAWRAQEWSRNFGITAQQYLDMVGKQGNRCAICHMPETATRNGEVKALAVDHNHTTGVVRELLCQTCNQMIGFAQDNPEVLRKAADYLDKHWETGNVIPIKSNDQNP